jgi:hypothetical protein
MCPPYCSGWGSRAMHLEQAIAALRFDPTIPIWALAALAVLALLANGFAAWRGARGTILRGAAFAVLVLWLAGPRLVEETRETLPDIGLLVVDQTASMSVGDRAKLAETARAAIVEQAARLPDLELRVLTVPERGDNGTQLFGAIAGALADIPRSRFAGTIAITDGQVHDIPSAAPGGAPINVLIPATGEETDRRLRVIEAPSFGIVGKAVTVKVAIDDLGTAGKGTAILTIRRDGEPPVTMTVPVGREQELTLPIARAGPSIVELSASPLPGEVSPLNNRAVVEINGVRDRLRVLLISGEPHAGERTWRRLLKADPSVDLVHFTILRPPERDDLTPLNELALIAFPVRELFQDKIGEFDLIILDRFQNRGLLPMPYLSNIARRVREGGALLLSVGPEFTGPTSLALTPLASVLPATPLRFNGLVEEKFRPWVSDLGQRHPVTEGLTGANLPNAAGKDPTWGSWYRRIQTNELRGDALLQTPEGQPLLVLGRIEKGRTALLLSDQIWLWSRGHEGGGPQAELLRRIAHWAMQEPTLEENALTAHIAQGRLTVERRSVEAGPPGSITVTGPDGQTTNLPLADKAPGQATASLPAAMPGVWRVGDGVRTAYAAAGAANPREIADLRATATLVGKLAHDSGGGVHWLGTAAIPDVPELRRTEPDRTASGGSWMGLQRRHDHVVTGIASVSLMPAWLSLPLLLGLMLLAWQREGR